MGYPDCSRSPVVVMVTLEADSHYILPEADIAEEVDRNFGVEAARSSEVAEVRNYLAEDSHHAADRRHTLVPGRRTWLKELGSDPGPGAFDVPWRCCGHEGDLGWPRTKLG